MAKKKNHFKALHEAQVEFNNKIEEKTEIKLGRPTIYTEELGERICKAIENSPRGLRWICNNNEDFPVSETIRDWLSKETYPIFSARYARAREMQADFLSDEIMDVTYDAKPDKFGRVEKTKLMVDAIKWKAKSLKPKVYGDKPELFLDTKPDAATKTDGATIAERLTNITDLITKKKKVSGD